jgi:hypothetical protein
MSLERKKIELNLMKCQTARMELEYKVEERKADIQRIKEHIVLQDAQEAKLKQELEDIDEKLSNHLNDKG